MTLNFPKVDRTGKTMEMLNDLLRINTDRIVGYQKALGNAQGMGLSLKYEFEKILSEGMFYKQQLVEKINELNYTARSGPTMFGKIYGAWTDLKVTFACDTQKTMLASCLYNEEIALHAYNAALNINAGISTEIRTLIEEQEENIRATYNQIRKYKEARSVSNYNLMYFN